MNKEYIVDKDAQQETGEDLKYLLYKYLKYWHWFVLGVFLMLILAFIYNRYATRVYSTSAQVKILKEGEGGLDLSGLQGATTLFDMNKVNLENEIQIFTSRRLLGNVVEDQELNTVIISEGSVKSVELWRNESPFKVHWYSFPKSIEAGAYKAEDLKTIGIKFTSLTNIELTEEESSSSIKAVVNDTVNFLNYKFSISLNPEYSSDLQAVTDGLYSFTYLPKNRAIDGLSKAVEITPAADRSEILDLTIQGAVKSKNEDVLNTLIQKFNQDGIYDKQLVSKRTEEFVEERLKFLEKELDTVEQGLVNFKRENNLVMFEANAQQLFTKEATAEKKRIQLETQLAISSDFKKELQNSPDFTLLPANIGIADNQVNELTTMYNQFVLDREKFLISATPNNPMVVNIEAKLKSLKASILSSVTAYVKNTQTALSSSRMLEQSSSSGLGKLPAKERGERIIRRQQEIKERLYLFLLQKREEAALVHATTGPVIKVVDYAYTSPIPVSPKTKIIYLAALIVGVLIPFGVLYVRFLLDTKLSSKEQVKRVMPNIPIVAEIPQLESGSSKNLLKANDRSVVAEAFRILRTNLSYVKKKESDKAQVIFVTSSTKGEGKTFVSINLSCTLASSNNKVLLIGADLRNPQLHTYVKKSKNVSGLSKYLYDEKVSHQDLIIKGVGDFKSLDMILSGSIPPNPAELIMNGRFEQLLSDLKAEYDYIIVDTAPTILVTDTLLISQHADVTTYVSRAKHTELKLLDHIDDLNKTNKLKNIALVINGLDSKSTYGYNYGYGYGYSAEAPSSKWKFWKK